MLLKRHQVVERCRIQLMDKLAAQRYGLTKRNHKSQRIKRNALKEFDQEEIKILRHFESMIKSKELEITQDDELDRFDRSITQVFRSYHKAPHFDENASPRLPKDYESVTMYDRYLKQFQKKRGLTDEKYDEFFEKGLKELE